MSGHSKWANIKHRKGAQDKRRGKIFTRIIKEVTVAVKESGADPSTNPKLRMAIQNGKGENMPKDTIERAIKKASGADAANYQDMTFEGYAPHGIAVFVECSTDNLNRTVASIRMIFSKYGGNLGTNGSLDFAFTRKGVFAIENENLTDWNLEELEMELIDAGLDELEKTEEVTYVFSNFTDFGTMHKKLDELKIEVKTAAPQHIPNTAETLNISHAKSVLHMIEKFEEDDDVSHVYHNLELTDELIASLED